MKPGEKFETECYEHLKKYYKTPNTDFKHEGGMDSTKSDIAVIKNGKVDFYIEVKDSSAQSGQFVLLPDEDTQKFIFSRRNKSEPNEITDIIIEYMNNDFHRFNNAGTAGQSLNIKSTIFSDWIIEHYKEKNVKYLISYNKGFVIFPINKFGKYFDITANYRIKKSGSGNPSQKDFNSIKLWINNYYGSVNFIQKDKKLYVKITEPLTQDKFLLGQHTYFLSRQDTNLYEIRKLSNTYNMNVIFSVKLIKAQEPEDLDEFKSQL